MQRDRYRAAAAAPTAIVRAGVRRRSIPVATSSTTSTLDAEEQARFALLEEHWDVVVNEVHPE